MGQAWSLARFPGSSVQMRRLLARANAVEATAAINRLVPPGQEGNHRLNPTGGADGRMHLPRTAPLRASSATSTILALGLPLSPALRAARWVVQQPLQLVELLLPCCEHEVLTAVSAPKRPVYKAHHLDPPLTPSDLDGWTEVRAGACTDVPRRTSTVGVRTANSSAGGQPTAGLEYTSAFLPLQYVGAP